jgi:hypothetical protein
MAITTKFDRVQNNFQIDSQLPDTSYTDIDTAVLVDGVLKIELDSGSGYTTLYENTNYSQPNYTVDVNLPGSANVTNNVLPVNLFKNADGTIMTGKYKFTYSEQFTNNSAGQDVLVTVSEFDYDGQVNVAMCLESLVSCTAPSITVKDTVTNYDVNNVTPTHVTDALTLVYPSSSNQVTIVDSSDPLEIVTGNVWTGGYSSVGTRILEYDFTDYIEKLTITAEHPFIVECDQFCDIYSCIKAFKTELDKLTVGSQKWQSMQATYEEIMSLAENIDVANACQQFDDIPPLIDQIKNLLNASDCTSGCDGCTGTDGDSKQVFGYGVWSAAGPLKTTDNGATTVNQTVEIQFLTGLTLTDTGNGVVQLVTDVQLAGGTTANRPSANLKKYTQYYDEDISKLVIWDGTNWVDSSGVIS